MRTEQVQIYQFKELSPDAQKKAIQKQLEYKWEYGLQDEFDMFLDGISYQLEEQGITLNGKIRDCLHWDFDNYNRGTISIKRASINLDKFYPNHSIVLGKGDFYIREGEIIIEEGNIIINNTNPIYEEMQETLKDKMDDLCQKFVKQWQEQEEYAQSEECLKQDIEANQYEYDKEGNRW